MFYRTITIAAVAYAAAVVIPAYLKAFETLNDITVLLGR